MTKVKAVRRLNIAPVRSGRLQEKESPIEGLARDFWAVVFRGDLRSPLWTMGLRLPSFLSEVNGASAEGWNFEKGD